MEEVRGRTELFPLLKDGGGGALIADGRGARVEGTRYSKGDGTAEGGGR